MRRTPERLVFIDETSVKTNLTRLRGRAPRGERLYGAAPFGAWNTQTFIAGLTSNGLIAPWLIKGAMNGAAFETYIRTQLAPALEPGKERWGRKGVEGARMLVPVLAALQPRPQSDRNGIRQAQGKSAPNWR
jgi:hypothetical protein